MPVTPHGAPLGEWRVVSAARFAANPRLSAPRPEPGADALADAMVRRHCAGMNGRLSGRRALAALRDAPDADPDAAPTIRWLLGSASIPDLHRLVWQCGVPIPRLADHARAHGMGRRPLVRWLNQFAALDC